jgi:hypothetical protein
LTGIEYALVTIELVKGEKVIRIDTSDALVNKTQDINFLIDPTKRSVSNFSVQCKLTSKSTTSLWIGSNIVRSESDKTLAPSIHALSTDFGSNYSLSGNNNVLNSTSNSEVLISKPPVEEESVLTKKAKKTVNNKRKSSNKENS